MSEPMLWTLFRVYSAFLLKARVPQLHLFPGKFVFITLPMAFSIFEVDFER